MVDIFIKYYLPFVKICSIVVITKWKGGEIMGKSRANKQNGYKAMLSVQNNDVYKFKKAKNGKRGR